MLSIMFLDWKSLFRLRIYQQMSWTICSLYIKYIAERRTYVCWLPVKATSPKPESGLLIDCVPRWEVGGIILQVAPARTIQRRPP